MANAVVRIVMRAVVGTFSRAVEKAVVGAFVRTVLRAVDREKVILTTD